MALTPQQRDIVIRTIAGEAANQGPQGQAAVAWSILNRSGDPRWPSDPQAVALQPKQYSTWNSGAGGNSIPRNISPTSALYREIGDVVDGVWEGRIPDPTTGAVYYGNVPNAKAGWGAFLNSQGNVSNIGAHTFAGRAQGIPQMAAYDPATFANTLGGLLGYAPPADGLQPNVRAANAMAAGELPEDVPGVPVEGEPSQEQLQSRFYDELFTPMQPNGPAWTAPPRTEMFNDAFGSEPAYPSREPRAFGPSAAGRPSTTDIIPQQTEPNSSPIWFGGRRMDMPQREQLPATVPTPIMRGGDNLPPLSLPQAIGLDVPQTSFPASYASNGFRQQAEQNLRAGTSGQPQGFSLEDMLTLPSQMDESGRPSYADQSLRGFSTRTPAATENRTIAPDFSTAFGDGGSPSPVRTSYVTPDTPRYRDDAVIAAMDLPPTAYTPDFATAFDVPSDMPDFNERFNGTQLPGTGYAALTGREAPTLTAFMAGPQMVPPPIQVAQPRPRPQQQRQQPTRTPRPTAVGGIRTPARGGLMDILRNPVAGMRSGLGALLGGMFGQGGQGGLADILGSGNSVLSRDAPLSNVTSHAANFDPVGGGSQSSYSTGTNAAGDLVTTDQWGNSWINNSDGTSTMLY